MAEPVEEALAEFATSLRRAADLLDAVARAGLQQRRPDDPWGPRRLFNYPEAAEYLRVGEGTMSVLAREGQIARTLIGRRVLFTREDLDEYIERCRRAQ